MESVTLVSYKDEDSEEERWTYMRECGENNVNRTDNDKINDVRRSSYNDGSKTEEIRMQEALKSKCMYVKSKKLLQYGETLRRIEMMKKSTKTLITIAVK